MKEFRAHAKANHLTATRKASLRCLHSFCSDLALVLFPSSSSAR
jgi:hypothetical protein